jgi:glycosyltransferase involved in cell wall biosynthesis
VFVHHAIIQRYLNKKHGLTDQVFFLKGGFSQMDASLIHPKTFYGFDREVMNICFVANRYDPMGLGKGYDVFINAAKRLSSVRPDCRFHVVGGWSRDIIDISDIGDRIQFHGYLATDALALLYSEMDAIISPTRIDLPREGKFDGFPLVTDAGMCGVAMFVSDPLGQNEDFVQGEDLEIILSEPDDVVERLLPYCSDPARLREMSIRGQRRISQLRNKEEKLAAKVAILKKVMMAKCSA